MKKNIIAALLVVSLAACNNESKNESATMPDSTTHTTMPSAGVDTASNITTNPAAIGNLDKSTNGNTASGNSNSGNVGTDTAAVGTNRAEGKDTASLKKLNGKTDPARSVKQK